MKVFAISRLFAIYIAKKLDKPHAIISITEPEPNNPAVEFALNENRIAVLHQKFYDIDMVSKNMTPAIEAEIQKEYGHGLFTDEQAREIVRFVKLHMDSIKALIVHCEAGISRSAGVAGAILKMTTGSDEKIFKDPIYIPNIFVYGKIIKAWLELDGVENYPA